MEVDKVSGLLAQVRAARRLPSYQRARAIREDAGVSQEQLADELGVHRVTVARWELGTRTPRGDTLRRYVELLDALDREVRGE
jgi:transcriptional regulator with XRE-family HTH domain